MQAGQGDPSAIRGRLRQTSRPGRHRCATRSDPTLSFPSAALDDLQHLRGGHVQEAPAVRGVAVRVEVALRPGVDQVAQGDVPQAAAGEARFQRERLASDHREGKRTAGSFCSTSPDP